MQEVFVLFYAFAKVGLLGFGGGHSIIPLIQVEVVNKWIYRCPGNGKFPSRTHNYQDVAAGRIQNSRHNRGSGGFVRVAFSIVNFDACPNCALFEIQRLGSGERIAQRGKTGGDCTAARGGLSYFPLKYQFLAYSPYRSCYLLFDRLSQCASCFAYSWGCLLWNDVLSVSAGKGDGSIKCNRTVPFSCYVIQPG